MKRERILRVVIADDERLARQRLRRLLGERRDVEIVAECSNGYEAIEAVQEFQPELLLLDVEMPEVDGFAVIEALRVMQRVPHVVLVTAFDKYAVRAFEIRAIDYLLKPVNGDRLDEAVSRVRAAIDDRTDSRAMLTTILKEVSLQRLRRFTIRGSNRIYFVPYADVDWMEAAGNYVQLHAGGDTHLIRTTMQSLEQSLDGTRFLRIHRSTMVNIDRVRELLPTVAGDYVVILKSGERLTLSRTYRNALDRITAPL